MEARTFRTKYDTWLLVLLALGFLLPAVLMLAVPPRPPLWIWLFFLPITAFVFWCLDTRYTFAGSELDIRSGPFRFRIPFDAIIRVYPTRDVLSSPAWSLDRVAIEYRADSKSRRLMISPKDRDGFLRVLGARCPQAAIERR